MEVVPAIDISGGKCVRLFKGKKGTETVYFENPLEAIDFWIEKGASRLHFVDLDGAWGSDKNKTLLSSMIKKAASELKVQIGGGIRSYESAIEILELGADRVIIGTMAIKKPDIIQKLSDMRGSEKIIVALDYKQGKISTHGWTEDTNLDPFIYGKKMEEIGAGYILFSSVESDGAFTGPDLENIKKMVASVNIPIYSAGGVRNKKDLENLRETGVYGVIVGKAFYENQLPFSVIRNF